MELRQLRAVLTIHDVGTVAGAAAVLDISQSALSRTLAALEGELDVMLFERTARGVRATAAGVELVARARILLRDADAAAEAARAAARAEAGQLRVGMLGSAMYTPMLDAISLFATRRPEVRLAIREMSSRAVLQALEEGSIDIGIGRARIRGRIARVVRSTPLRQDVVVAVVSRSHVLAGTGTVEPVRLADFPLIATDSAEEPDLIESLTPLLAGARVDVARDSWTIVRLAEAGIGVGLVPAAMAGELRAHHGERIDVLEVLPAVRLPDLTLSIRTDQHNPAVAALLNATPELAALTSHLRP